MELKYPWVLYIGIPILLILIIFKFKKKSKYTKGTKVANTQYAKKIPYYQTLLAKYKLFVGALKIVCVISIIISLFLISRPYTIETSQSEIHSRDIFLCIDASTSVNPLTYDLTKKLKDMIDELQGERIGITIFNTVTVTLCPLTDDYEYIKDVLDDISKGVEEYDKYERHEDYDSYYAEYLLRGTITGSGDRGSSLIADGIVSCLKKFPNYKKDTDRTRIIILTTDNVDSAFTGKEDYTMEEAMGLISKYKMHLFAIAPAEGQIEESIWVTHADLVKGREELEKSVKSVNGKYFEYDSEETMGEIVSEINNTTKSLVKSKIEKREVGKPEIAFITLIISISILFFISKKVKI